jgi:hypothetical protein
MRPASGATALDPAGLAKSPAAAALPGAQPNWPYVVAALPALLLLLLGATYRDRYVVEPTEEYQKAVDKWHKTLLPNPDTRTPRELKRFMNVSRYVVARREASWPVKPSISESTIVEFTARWALARASGRSPMAPQELAANDQGAVSEERVKQAVWFLRVVGDMGG